MLRIIFLLTKNDSLEYDTYRLPLIALVRFSGKGLVVSRFERNGRASRMKSHGHSPLGSIKDRVDAIGLEHLSVLPHIQYNGTDEPITFFDLIIGARSQIRGQGLCREA